MSEIKQLKDRIAQLKKEIAHLEREVSRLEKGGVAANANSRKSQKKEPQPQKVKTIDDEPGILGIFDGVYMVTEAGERFEVPATYAAKSRLVYGDTLKMIDKEGKQFFKQAEKVRRKRIEGILNKKEGKWYLLSDSGSYRISDTAAQYNEVKLNDEAVAFIPENNLNVPFAALDSVLRDIKDAAVVPSSVAPKTGVQEAEKVVEEVVIDLTKDSNEILLETKPVAASSSTAAEKTKTEKSKVDKPKTSESKPNTPDSADTVTDATDTTNKDDQASPRIIRDEDLR